MVGGDCDRAGGRRRSGQPRRGGLARRPEGGLRHSTGRHLAVAGHGAPDRRRLPAHSRRGRTMRSLIAVLLLLLGTATAFAAAQKSTAPQKPTFEEAVALFSDKKYKAAYEVASPLATAGDGRAQAMLGALYEEGRGVGKDVKTPATWYETAARGGHVGAMFALAMIYLDGRLGPPDFELGRKWLTAAAEGGHTAAQHNLGLLLAGAGGRAPNWEEAGKWFQAAASQGLPDA